MIRNALWIAPLLFVLSCSEQEFQPNLDTSEPAEFISYKEKNVMGKSATFHVSLAKKHRVDEDLQFTYYRIQSDEETAFRAFYKESFNDVLNWKVGEEYFSAHIFDNVYEVTDGFGNQVKVNDSVSAIFVGLMQETP